jgi:hypothetical protein
LVRKQCTTNMAILFFWQGSELDIKIVNYTVFKVLICLKIANGPS